LAEESDMATYASTTDEILQAVRENSIRRGLFFLKNLAALDLETVIQAVEQLSQSYDMEAWREVADQAGIPLEALDVLDRMEPRIPYPFYFCLPGELQRQPRLILYYRNVAIVSNKVMTNIGMGTAQYEIGMPIETEKAVEIAKYLNDMIGSLVLQQNLLGSQRHLEMTYASVGASIDGGWRNEVGRLAYVSVITPLITYMHGLKRVESINYRLKGRIVYDDDEEREISDKEQTTHILNLDQGELKQLLDSLEEERIAYRQINMTNGNQVLLNRQIKWADSRIGPDLITGTPVEGDLTYPWAGELKGGADPAGSDEHWKTATQAFNRIIEAAENAGQPVPMLSFMATILVDRVAREAELWLQQGKLTSVHNLTKIANDPRLQQKFMVQMLAFFESKSAQ
jgi:hypothetical protein